MLARRLEAALVALVTLVLLTACGQKGPLVLPEANETGAAPADEDEPASRDDEEDS